MYDHLTFALVLTGLVYVFNANTGGYGYTVGIDTNTDYALLFIFIFLGLAVLYRYYLPPGTAPPSIMRMIGLEPPSHGPTGEPTASCYSVPYKVVNTQYGDKALLAGYNENVQPQEGGARGGFDHPTIMPREECRQAIYSAELLPITKEG